MSEKIKDMKANIVRLLSENTELKRERDEAREERDWAIKQISTLQSTFEDWQLKMLSEQAEALHRIDAEYDKLFDEAHQIRIERDEARERERVAIVSWEEERQRALREGHRVVDAMEKNAKLRDISERAIERIERENWGITEVADFWKQLRVELDQLKEGAKCPVCSPEQKCWECADDVSQEGVE